MIPHFLALFHLFSVIGYFKQLWMGSLGDNNQSMLVLLKVPFFALNFSSCALMIFLMMLSVIILSVLSTLYSKCDQAFDLWLKVELPSVLEYDLRYTVDWSGEWLVDFSIGKTQFVSFNCSNSSGAIGTKMNGFVLEEKSSLKIL